MRYLFIATLLLFALHGYAQEAKPADTAKKIYTYVERMPAPPYSLNKYLQTNLHYPEAARENNIEGRVLVKFVVDEKGRIRDCAITKGIGGGCDEEALRVVEEMPRWTPGKQKKLGGKFKRVKVYFNLPIVFKLQ